MWFVDDVDSFFVAEYVPVASAAASGKKAKKGKEDKAGLLQNSW
jgi:hypothetical protein